MDNGRCGGINGKGIPSIELLLTVLNASILGAAMTVFDTQLQLHNVRCPSKEDLCGSYGVP